MDLAARLACPACHSALSKRRRAVACAGCRRTFPVSVGGVPDLLLPEALGAEQRRTVAEWEHGAPAYRAMLARLPPSRFEPIDRPLLAAAHGDVVEVGCGDGRLLAKVDRSRVRSILGVEPARPLAEAAAARGLPVVRGSAERLPLHDASVDVLLAGYYALRYSHLDTALAEAARALRPGGRLAFTLVGRRAARLAAVARAVPLLACDATRWSAARLLVGLGDGATLPNDVDGCEALRTRLARSALRLDELLGVPNLPIVGRLPGVRGRLAAALAFDVVVLAYRA